MKGVCAFLCSVCLSACSGGGAESLSRAAERTSILLEGGVTTGALIAACGVDIEMRQRSPAELLLGKVTMGLYVPRALKTAC